MLLKLKMALKIGGVILKIGGAKLKKKSPIRIQENNFNSSYTAQDLDSQAEYGLFAEQFNSYLKNAADVEDVADRLIGLRAWPRNTFQSITFALQSPEIDNADRDALLNIFMGQPVRITNLPLNILGGEFTGFVEGWSFEDALKETIVRNWQSFKADWVTVKPQVQNKWDVAGITTPTPANHDAALRKIEEDAKKAVKPNDVIKHSIESIGELNYWLDVRKELEKL